MTIHKICALESNVAWNVPTEVTLEAGATQKVVVL